MKKLSLCIGAFLVLFLMIGVYTAQAICVVTLPSACNGPICKTVTYTTGDGDCDIELGDPVTYTMTITVIKPPADEWSGAIVTDTIASNLELVSKEGSCGVTSSGRTQIMKLNWNIGNAPVGDATFTCKLKVRTDKNPGPNQEYTACGWHVVNSGPNLKFKSSDGKWYSYRTDAIAVWVPGSLCPELE